MLSLSSSDSESTDSSDSLEASPRSFGTRLGADGLREVLGIGGGGGGGGGGEEESVLSGNGTFAYCSRLSRADGHELLMHNFH